MFIDPAQFPFARLLEDSWETIRDEYLALPAEVSDPWVQRDLYDGTWTVFGLIALGKPIPAAARCPKTCQILEQIPTVSMAAYSRLAGGAHVKAHTGWAKSVYRAHLGLVVPPGCRFRVRAQTLSWVEGQCLFFDDTMEHEAWNDSDQARVVLILDVLRPGVTIGTHDHLPEELEHYAKHLLAQRETR
jgi:beta-hydroxylase